MWDLKISNTNPRQNIVFSDGLPITDSMVGRGLTYRLMVLNIGYIDIVDCNKSSNLILFMTLNLTGFLARN